MPLRRLARNSAAALAAGALSLTGRVRKARAAAFQEGIITPIALHNPTHKLFRSLVGWLRKNGFSFISTAELIKILSRESVCPRGAVWISLDDGWRGNIDDVIPVTNEFNIPVTIFVSTGAVTEGTFWWRKIAQSGHLLPPELRDVSRLKKLPEEERRKAVLEIDNKASCFPREAMTVEDVQRLSTMPQVTLGAHTVNHPILPNCTAAQIEYEITESKNTIEKWTGKPVVAFAYPNGDYDGRERPYLEKAGYKIAATTQSGPGRAGDDCLVFPRNVLLDDGSLGENICHALGIWEPFVKVLKKPGRKP